MLWPSASSRRSEKLVVSVGGKTRGSLGRAKRMEVWVEKTAWSGLIPHGMVAVDFEEMAARAVETGSGMAYHRRRWRPPNRNTRWGTSEDAREGAFGVTWVSRGSILA